MDTIVEEHEKKERAYPRPQIDCPDCGEKVIICWGEKIDPYLRHKAKTDCKPSAESWMHKEAKRRLCKFLNEEGICHFVHGCNGVLVTPPRINYEEEVTFGKSRLDIGGIDKNGKTVFDIEIFCTNKTTNLTDRDGIFWVEVESIEVLSSLDLAKMPKEITLKDVSKKRCCPKSESRGPRILKFDVEDRKEMAIRLGYMKRIHTERYFFILLLAMNGKAVRTTEEWFSGTKEKADRREWLSFLEHEKCLHCGEHWETSWYKPYCLPCYILVENNKVDFEDKVEISRHVKIDLKKRLSWLNDVKNVIIPSAPCSMCNKLNIHTDLPTYVTWFGKQKLLCWDCLDHRLEKDGIYDINLN